MEAQPLVVQTRVTTSIVRLVESILMLISASEEHYSEKMLRYYKSELYELLCFVRLCSTQKRNLYVSLGRGNKSKKAHAEWKKEMARVNSVTKRLQRELGDGGRRQRRRKR